MPSRKFYDTQSRSCTFATIRSKDPLLDISDKNITMKNMCEGKKFAIIRDSNCLMPRVI